MPWVLINVLEGLGPEKKKLLHKEVAAAIQRSLDIPAEWVKVQITEMKSEDHSIGGLDLTEYGK